METTSSAPAEHAAAFRVKETGDQLIVLTIPGTDYELHLVPEGTMSAEAGKRIRGTLSMEALRLHRSDTGGRFIEPVYGTPRIVQGSVIAVDEPNRRVLFDLAVPAWITPLPEQSIELFQPGELWNAYVKSGSGFVPAEA